MDKTDFSSWVEALARQPGLFMTGTDTGVGKTWVGTRLLQHLQQRGLTIAPRKPVESGWPTAPSALSATDAYQLAAACGQTNKLAQVCPNRLKAPLSPPRAAQLEQRELAIATLAQQCRHAVPPNEFLYVEGAGGFYSPLAQDGLNADLAQALALPVVLTGADRVGCINHILLSAAAIQARGLTLSAIILNPIHPGPSGMDNQTELQALLNLPILYLPKLHSNRPQA